MISCMECQWLTRMEEVLLIGTGQRNVQPPPFLRPYLNQLGITLDCMDTVRTRKFTPRFCF